METALGRNCKVTVQNKCTCTFNILAKTESHIIADKEVLMRDLTTACVSVES